MHGLPVSFLVLSAWNVSCLTHLVSRELVCVPIVEREAVSVDIIQCIVIEHVIDCLLHPLKSIHVHLVPGSIMYIVIFTH